MENEENKQEEQKESLGKRLAHGVTDGVKAVGRGVTAGIEGWLQFEKEHKEVASIIKASVLIPTATIVGNSIKRSLEGTSEKARLKEEERRDERRRQEMEEDRYERLCRFYDPRTGRTSYSKRPLNPDELAYVSREYRENRRSYSELLWELGVLSPR